MPLATMAMDFVIWLQLVMVHAVPLLWRMHRVHHADPDYDLTTGTRFHPIEILLSMQIKIATIAVLGPPVLAVVIFEVLLNPAAVFNLGNIRLVVGLGRVLRRVWSRQTCTGCITRPKRTRLIPTSASTCLGGTVCLAHTANNHVLANWVWSSAFMATRINARWCDLTACS